MKCSLSKNGPRNQNRWWKCATVMGLLLFLVSCGTSGGEGLGYNYKQGVSELQVRFINNAPPDRIYSNSAFKMILELENPTAYDITDGDLKLLGLDDKYFQITPLEHPFRLLPGRSVTNPVGDRVFLEFDGTALQLIESAEEYTANYYLKMKYKSTSEFSDTICINPNLYAVYDAGCTVEPQKSYGGQGGPLTVTSLEEIISPGGTAQLEFRFIIENRGSGKIEFVNLKKARLGSEELFCGFPRETINKQSARFTDEKQQAVLICKSQLRDQSSYTTTLSLDLAYDYEVKQMQTLRMVSSSVIR